MPGFLAGGFEIEDSDPTDGFPALPGADLSLCNMGAGTACPQADAEARHQIAPDENLGLTLGRLRLHPIRANISGRRRRSIARLESAMVDCAIS